MNISFIHIPKNGGSSIRMISLMLKEITYYSHNVNVFNANIKNQLIILRDPIHRFQSAVNYAIENFSHIEPQKTLIHNNITTPEQWVQIKQNKHHKFYKHVMKELLNSSDSPQIIGNKKPFLKWTYDSQIYYINNPKYVILFENLNEELLELFKYHNIDFKYIIPNKNYTKAVKNTLSESSINYLKQIYKKDIKIYNYYKNIDKSKRLQGLL